MRVYSVHENPAYTDDRRIVLVKEGFCWPALFFTIIWAIYRRVWLGLGVYIIGIVVLAVAETVAGVQQPVPGLLSIAFALLVAAEANDWRCRALAGRGYREVATVIGENLDDAERRYFELAADAHAVTPNSVAPNAAAPGADPEPAGAA